MKYIKSSIIILLFIFILGYNIGCINKENEKEVIDYNIDLSFLPTDIKVDNFLISDIKLEVIYNDNTKETIDLDQSMLVGDSKTKIKEVGINVIEVSYKGIKKEFQIEIKDTLFKVVFYDFYGNKVSEEEVAKGSPATIPTLQEIDGYLFNGFDSDDLLNVQSDLEVRPVYLRNKFYVTFTADNMEVAKILVEKGRTISDFPEIPFKAGYTSKWEIDSSFIIINDIEVKAIYETDIDKVCDDLFNQYNDILVLNSLYFVTEINGFILNYETDNSCISSQGVLTKPYQDTTVNMIIKVKSVNSEIEREVEVKMNVKGYKRLDDGIASSYVYRSYDKLTDEFFYTMDIIYCAFILFDSNGNLTNNNTVLNNITKYVLPKAKEKGIYTIISLGGGGAAPRDAFVSVTSDSAKRKKLIDNVINLINQYQLDGVDIDWETPTTSQSPYFTLFTKELYEAVKKNNPNHLVTCAITGGKWQPPKYDLINSIAYLDYVNVMTYGMVTNGGGYQNALYHRDGYHNTECKVGSTTVSCSIKESIKVFNDLGVSNNKLIFGLAFYGIKQTYKNGSWVNGGSVYYTNIKNEYLNNSNYKYYYDEVAEVPYLLSNDQKTFISFDDIRSVTAKSEFVIREKCAGVMYWENGCDLTGDLVHAICEVFATN